MPEQVANKRGKGVLRVSGQDSVLPDPPVLRHDSIQTGTFDAGRPYCCCPQNLNSTSNLRCSNHIPDRRVRISRTGTPPHSGRQETVRVAELFLSKKTSRTVAHETHDEKWSSHRMLRPSVPPTTPLDENSPVISLRILPGECETKLSAPIQDPVLGPNSLEIPGQKPGRVRNSGRPSISFAEIQRTQKRIKSP